ncbi:hypothetical protein Tsubulata_050314 [Turnera subulata]|uniref:Bifunctional inhibitor/plant lipid transfer protein/seed storage helical domain-containing protein n=1 Tax=Turnera subulata TaxID=218843 RepID=A0A9Q0GH67_9ROSI|nr:hypothetical protein Tsubulata_050314 [Turnera subulata]
MERGQKLVVVAAIMVLTLASNIGMHHLYFCRAQSICKMPVDGLMSCKPAVTPPNPTAPSPGCCSALSHADMNCLCSYRNSKLLPSLGIDPNLAMQLPGKCKLPHPANC